MLTFVVFISVVGAQVVGTAQIYAPAVILQNNTGVLTLIEVSVSGGNGTVVVTGPQTIGESTTQSAVMAAEYATKYLNVNFNNYNFNYTIEGNSDANVSGPSAGAAMALLAVSALSGEPLLNNFTMTGTVSDDGVVGSVGGVYDKVGAASASDMKFVLVPAVPQSSLEEELYILIQAAYGVPLVPVTNISNAWHYATSVPSTLPSASYDFYTDYKVGSLPNAQLTCSNACNQQGLSSLANFTTGFTRAAIENLSKEPGFYNISVQLSREVAESSSIISKGYIYVGSNFAFLTYLDTFYMLNHATNLTRGLSTLNGVQSYCSALTPGQLTNLNYEYLLGGELRQYWASYTLNNTINNYNTSSIDTDEILTSLRFAGTANAWCNAANFMYQTAANIGGTPVAESQSLKNIAAARINQASQYPGMYLSTAELAYKQGNYALAMLTSAYASSFVPAPSTSVPALIADATQLARNSTYGAWATQFANEALFYVYEAQLTTNSTTAQDYATTAYQTALLASQISNDTRIIQENLVNAPATTTIPVVTTIPMATATSLSIELQAGTLMLVIVVLVVSVVLLAIVLGLLVVLIRMQAKQNKGARRRRRAR